MSVPQEAAAWICAILNQDELRRFKKDTNNDLCRLTVADLKRVFVNLQEFSFLQNHPLGYRYSLNNKPKQEVVRLVQQCFYVDVACTQPYAQALLELEEATKYLATAPPMAPSATTVPLLPGAAIHAAAGTATMISQIKPLLSSPTVIAPRPTLQLPLSQQAPALNQPAIHMFSPATFPQPPTTAPQPPTTQPPASTTQPSPKPSEFTTLNSHESSLLTSLLAMGFQDRSEILTSIRRWIHANNNSIPEADAVMFDIILHRHQEEEGEPDDDELDRQLDVDTDRARILSEQSRHEERSKRQKIEKDAYTARAQHASMDDLQRNVYPKSWLLRMDTFVAKVRGIDQLAKNSLIELLELEKSSGKWYPDTPKAHFCHVVTPRLVAACDVVDQIKKEVECLQTALFRISEQAGGLVPKIFLEAHEAFGKLAVDDDEVELVGHVRERPAASHLVCSVEVIEIL